VAVDGAHIYWANQDSQAIGRADLNRSNVNQSFITVNSPCGVAVDGAHIYWGNVTTKTIGRANLDGTGVDQSFITGAENPCGVAVDSGPAPPSNQFSVGKVKKNRRNGTAKLTVSVPGPGALTLTGKGVVTQRPAASAFSRQVSAAGAVKMLVKPKGKAKRKLNRTGKVKVRVAITYTPTGGSPNSQSKRLALRKRLL
jgi:hypothetical protein